jgi:hypothetical protein
MGGLRFAFQDSGFKIQGSRFRARFRVQGSGFEGSGTTNFIRKLEIIL